MRMIAGFLEPDEGVAKIFNIDVAQDRRRAQERVGYLPEGAPLYGEMTPLDLSALRRRSARHDPRSRPPRVRRAAQDARLGDTIDRPIETLSKGYRRRVGLAAALLHDPTAADSRRTDGRARSQSAPRRARSDPRLGEERGAHHFHAQRWKKSKRSARAPSSSIKAASSPTTTPAALPQQHGSLDNAFRALTHGEDARQ